MHHPLALTLLLALAPPLLAGETTAPTREPWRGVHLWVDNDASARELIRTLPALAHLGVNKLVLEVNYSFEFETHPELRQQKFIRRTTARELSRAAATHGIQIIPEFNCLGHQSFGRRIEPLLKVHPEFNETPSLSLTNPAVYCLSWCPRAPGLQATVRKLIDEIADGFAATAFHVGMDEVYLIAAEECPRCRGQSPAQLFADQVRVLHEHIAGRRKLEMLMWADRVIGPKYQGYSKYDQARNDLSAAREMIPKDIVQCDWHYVRRDAYPSIPLLTGAGFRVWPSGFKPVATSRALSDFAQQLNDPKVLGYLATTWNETSITNAHNWPPIQELIPRWTKEAQTEKTNSSRIAPHESVKVVPAPDGGGTAIKIEAVPQ